MPEPAATQRIVLAVIGAPHGVRGEVRLKTFTADPGGVGGYGPLDAPDGRRFTVRVLRPAAGTSPDMVIARIAGVDDRTAAEALTGLELSIPRDRLPAADADDFYHADLIGLAAVTVAGEALGTIIAVPNYGGGDLLEIAPPRAPSLLVPFTRAVVPVVDVAGGKVVVDPPPGLLDGGDEQPPDEEGA